MFFEKAKRFIFGRPLSSQSQENERLGVFLGLAVFSADALSSTAYATDEILIALTATCFGPCNMALVSIPVALAIVLLISIVILSYRQVIKEYQDGGGSYVVAKENLGTAASHIAAASLLIDYVLTVAVSICAGVAALTSAGIFPYEQSANIALIFAAIMTILNLRGLRESGEVFAPPAYIFLISIFSLIVIGVIKIFNNDVYISNVHNLYDSVSNNSFDYSSLAFLLMFCKAFAHGCAGLTGIEAVSNGVKSFKEPSYKRANTTMLLIGIFLSSIFFSITFLASAYAITPKTDETILSQVASVVFTHGSFCYMLVQFSTMIILVIAANTAFAGFPRVSYLLASDGFLPRQLMSIGDRLVFSNGILLLGLSSMFLIWFYNGDTHSLIPLYAVGVFISFTLSQFGMVVHHLRKREAGWRVALTINAIGGTLTALVTLLLAIEKFVEGAWIVIIAIPLFIMIFRSIKAHYNSIQRQVVINDSYTFHSPQKHTVFVLVSSLSKVTIPAINYAKTLRADEVEAVHIEFNPRQTEQLKRDWEKWGLGIKLTILPSPFRSITRPILRYLDSNERTHPDSWITIIVPEFITKKFWHNFLHNQTAMLLKAILRFHKGIVVVTVRYHLEE